MTGLFCISGVWRHGQLNGWGRMVNQNGEKFEGSWVQGRKEGVGFCVNHNGDWFEGREKLNVVMKNT